MADSIIGIKELHKNLKRVADAAMKGKSFTVVRDSKPVFRIEPVEIAAERSGNVEDFLALKFKGDADLSKRIDEIAYADRR
ncbi:MAG TPA: hypothetical protein VJL57_01625 [Candidatus Paceibacterota bacterium]